jgi:hypothetical protein
MKMMGIETSASLLAALLLLAATLGAVPATAQQLVSVDPGDAWLDADDGYRDSVTWRVASKGGASSEKGVFVDLDNNRVLGSVDLPLKFSGDNASVDERLVISAAQARQWFREGVRRLGYRRTFSGAAGSLANRVVFDLEASGRLAQVSATPAQQTLSNQSQKLMLAWRLDSELGEVNAHSSGGQFLLGDEVIYEVTRPLNSGSGTSINELVELPPGLVQELMDNGIYQLRYSRTFVDDKDTRRSASVALNLAQ